MGDFEVIIDEKTERYDEFMKVFGTNIVKIKSPVSHLMILPNKQVSEVYFLDLDLLTKEQKESLITHLSKKFNQTREFTETNLNKIGVPILREGCSLVINNPQRWF